jgi:hypothetical protein
VLRGPVSESLLERRASGRVCSKREGSLRPLSCRRVSEKPTIIIIIKAEGWCKVGDMVQACQMEFPQCCGTDGEREKERERERQRQGQGQRERERQRQGQRERERERERRKGGIRFNSNAALGLT